MKPRERSVLCSAIVGWISVLCICPQSSEWVNVDGMGYILCLVGGRNRMSVCLSVRVRVRVRLHAVIMWRHPSFFDTSALSNCTREEEDLQPHSTVLRFS